MQAPRNLVAARAKSVDHDQVIAEIAREAGLPVSDVAGKFALELASLKDGAKIDLYLELLAAKRVRSALRNPVLEAHASPTRQ